MTGIRFLILLGLLVATMTASANADDQPSVYDILSRDVVGRCVNYKYNVAQLVPEYYCKNKMDSLKLILKIWEDSCGTQPEADQIWTLIDIKDGKYKDLPYDSALGEVLCSFVDTVNDDRNWFMCDIITGIRIQYYASLGDVIDSLADEAIAYADTLTYPYLYCLMLKREPWSVLKEIQSPELEGTPVREAYDRRIDAIMKNYFDPYVHYSFLSGIWIPSGANEVLGNHPQIGVSGGLVFGQWVFDGVFMFRFLNSKESYVMKNGNGELETTCIFNSIFIGTDTRREIFGIGRYAFDITGGFGYDGFYGIAHKGDDDSEKAVNSFNLNLGHKSRIFLDKYRTRYIGLQVQYNWVWYTTHGGTDLSGNSISLTLCYGAYPKAPLKENLEDMNYIQ